MQHYLLFTIIALFVLELQGSVTDACQDRAANCKDQTDQWCQENPMAPFDCYKRCGFCSVTVIESAMNSTSASKPVRVPVSTLWTSFTKVNSNSMPAVTTETPANSRSTSAEASMLPSTTTSLINSMILTAVTSATTLLVTAMSTEESTLTCTPITATTFPSFRNSTPSTATTNTVTAPIPPTSEGLNTDTLDIGMATGATIGGLAGLAAAGGGVYLAASRTKCAKKTVSGATGFV